MKYARALPIVTLLLCIPGLILRAMHFVYGFDVVSGLPVAASKWYIACIVFFLACAILLYIIAAPLKAYQKIPFESSFGTKDILFRMLMVISGMLLMIGGVYYFYMVLKEPSVSGVPTGTKMLEYIYAGLSLLAGGCVILFAKKQGEEMTKNGATLILVTLLWSCIHLLVDYRVTCIDPKLSAYAFGLIAGIVVVVSVYFFCAMLFGKPRPHLFAWLASLAVIIAVSNFGGYGFALLMKTSAAAWDAKECLRCGMTTIVCVFLFAELLALTNRQEIKPES